MVVSMPLAEQVYRDVQLVRAEYRDVTAYYFGRKQWAEISQYCMDRYGRKAAEPIDEEPRRLYGIPVYLVDADDHYGLALVRKEAHF